MKLLPAGRINYGVYFQMVPGGPICTAHNRYARNGRKTAFQVQFFKHGKTRLYTMNFKKTENANKRMLILREDISGSAKQRDRLHIQEVDN